MTKQGYLGMMAHWIDLNTASGKWTLQAEVVGFYLIRGTHAGSDLGHYFVGLCDRVDITSHSHSKVRPCLFSFDVIQLYTVTLDNTMHHPTTLSVIPSSLNIDSGSSLSGQLLKNNCRECCTSS
jgi:hypothetical protein